MHALVLCDDIWHPARTTRVGLQPLEQAGVTLDWIENAGDWSAERMAGYPVVILAKSNNVSSADQAPWVTEEVEASFLAHISAGNGLLAMHSGTAGYEERAVLRKIMGGVFTSHPEQCPVTVEPDAGHVLSAGCAPFTLVDEHYMMAQDDPQADVFLTTVSEYGRQPGGWARYEGKGRVCVLTPGHNLEVWLHPSYQTIIHNALRWCSRLS